jgi:hypothetical protein
LHEELWQERVILQLEEIKIAFLQFDEDSWLGAVVSAFRLPRAEGGGGTGIIHPLHLLAHNRTTAWYGQWLRGRANLHRTAVAIHDSFDMPEGKVSLLRWVVS